jgi:mannose-1-phosphate guanylyltransferase/mannose-1-phosphate guanylyltransferase/mannose-6-phosphate isomerase
MIVPVILSGGEGRRLWPLSSPDRPKQFLALTGEETLLQQTVRRLADPGMFAAPIIIGGAGQRFLIAEQLRAAQLDAGRIVLEPVGRNTAPALAVGALIALAADPAALILSAHADAAIPDADAFRAAVARGVAAAEAGWLVLFGIAPAFAADAYGYIVPGEPLDVAASRVAAFVEKPPAAEAAALIAAGALWNSGIFLMRAARLVAAFEAHAPQVLAAARRALAAAAGDADFLRLDPDAFAASPSIAIDHAIFERTAHAAVIAAGFAWSDIGSWSAVREAQARDGAGNAVRGPVVLEDVRGSLVFSDGPRVAACGVEGLVIVATAERVLVAPLSRDQEVRRLAERSDRGPGA